MLLLKRTRLGLKIIASIYYIEDLFFNGVASNPWDLVAYWPTDMSPAPRQADARFPTPTITTHASTDAYDSALQIGFANKWRPFRLNAGSNTITATAVNSSGGPNMDQIALSLLQQSDPDESDGSSDPGDDFGPDDNSGSDSTINETTSNGTGSSGCFIDNLKGFKK